MGAETTCRVRLNGKDSTVRARLETNILQLRGRDLKLDIPFSEMKRVNARGGVLSIGHKDRQVVLALGPSASKWVEKILHPPSRLSKLGLRSDSRVMVLGDVGADFVEEVGQAAATVSVGRAIKDADLVFVGVSRPSDFDRIAAAKSAIRPDGAVWLIRPKGHADITEARVMAAGKAAGLVDVKVVGFSETHSALKFVIRLKDR